MANIPPLILTLKLDAVSQGFFDSLRKRHFPPERNFIPAHVSLFNQLPGELLQSISDDIEGICYGHEPFFVEVEKLRSLGKGVAYVLKSPKLASLRGDLVGRWSGFLGPQDHQKFGGHLTVQNKVSPGEARSLLERLQVDFEPFEVGAEGVVLWRYLGGPWEKVREYALGG